MADGDEAVAVDAAEDPTEDEEEGVDAAEVKTARYKPENPPTHRAPSRTPLTKIHQANHPL